MEDREETEALRMSEGDDPISDSDEFLRAIARAPEAAAPTSSPELPAQVGPFKILERIGRGGMGIVYRAEDEKLKRVVALKVLPQDFDEDGHRRRRFLREARLAASIAHPNVATIHEVGEADDRIYIAMELVRGKTLRARGKVTIEEAVRIVKEIARGVAKAHAAGIAHRDLKPDNVMISNEGEVKVLDFGLAKPTEEKKVADDPEQATVTQEGRIVGTPGYMSPEQATGRGIDVRTDVFSLGVILYELLTGTRPFKGETSMDQLIATSRDEYTPPSDLNPKVSAAIEKVVDRCLKKEPQERFTDAAELLAALDAAGTAPPKELGRSPWIMVVAVVTIGIGAARLVLGGETTAASTQTPPIATSVQGSPSPPIPTASEIAPAPKEIVAPPIASAIPAATSAAPIIAPVKAPPPRPVVSVVVPAEPKPPPAPPPSAPGGVIETSPY